MVFVLEISFGKIASFGQEQPQGIQSLMGLSEKDWSVFTQATYVDQWHYGFPSAYEGPNSLTSAPESESTFSFTLFLDKEVWPGAELIYNPEVFQGHGLSRTFGVAGFPNGEAVKSGFANLHYNTSRLLLRQTFGLGGETETLDADHNQVAGKVDVNRITVSVGKFAANDIFDDNAYSHDPRTQFMNWALWESAAWDYPADIVGFTGGAVVEWNTPNTTLHYGILMEPTEANGARLDYHVAEAHGQILQFDYRYSTGSHKGTVRPFVYWNQARMGSYNLASTQTYPADVTLTRAYRSKVGFGVSWDQELTQNLGAFVRFSWNDGRTESFSFTEIDESIAAGLSLKGTAWGRANDVLGLALALNGPSTEHQRYLEDGGTGLILGDGALSYAPEQIAEFYYAFQPWRWMTIGPDVQYVRNPGYNSVRGPVTFYAVRCHMEF